jgi:hypothetical protein
VKKMSWWKNLQGILTEEAARILVGRAVNLLIDFAIAYFLGF